VHVVPAGVHHRDLGAIAVLHPPGTRVRQAGLLKHREGVHVGAQQHGRAVPVREHPDHAGAAHRGRDLVAKASQPFRDDARRPVLGERKLRMRVQVAVQRGQLIQVRDIGHRKPPWVMTSSPGPGATWYASAGATRTPPPAARFRDILKADF
jgi:hypothetical protein